MVDDVVPDDVEWLLQWLDVDTVYLMRGAADAEAFHYRMRTDPRFAAEISFCCDAGLPHLVFLGRVVAPGEPLWTDHDRDVAISYRSWRAALCGGCGMHPLDWPEERPAEDPLMIEFVTCFTCRLHESASKTIGKGKERETHLHFVPYDEQLFEDSIEG